MKFGSKESEINFLDRHLIKPRTKLKIEVYIFGSRSTGKNHPYFDIDILISGGCFKSCLQ